MELDMAAGRMLLDFEFHEDLQRKRHRQEQHPVDAESNVDSSSVVTNDSEYLLTAQLVRKLGTELQMTPGPGDQRPLPVQLTTEVQGQPCELPASFQELPPSLSRRARQLRPMAPRTPAEQPSGRVQLPLIGGPHQRQSHPVRAEHRGSSDRLAALANDSRQVGFRVPPVNGSDSNSRLARLPSRNFKAPASANGADSHLLRLESAEKEGRSDVGKRRPFTAAPANRSYRGSSGDSASKASRYVVINGRTRTEAADFEAFQLLYRNNWSWVTAAIWRMEQFLKTYSIPIAFVNGEKLFELAETFEFDVEGARKPTVAQLLGCLINQFDVARLVAQPGRRFAGKGGVVQACTIIQAHWRGFQQRKSYHELRRRNWAAGVIAIQWLVYRRLKEIRSRLCESRLSHIEGHRRRLKHVSKCWNEWQRQRRVIIHLPSLGYPRNARVGLRDFDRLQNTQMARLCDIRDPNVDVVLLCPLPLSSELEQYYNRLAALHAAIQSGKPEDQKDASQRFRIIVPEAVGKISEHNFCLATLLNYSPKALNQIREIITGRRAYIVPGLPCADDLAIADYLDIPILCPEPELTQKFSSGSSYQELLEAAKLPTPPGECCITSLPHLAESLARLITSYLDVKRWSLKLNQCPPLPNDDHLAILNVERLICYQWALDERSRFGDKWSKLWAQERVYLKVLDELLSSALTQQICEDFLAQFSSHGGSIGALPEQSSLRVTYVTADLCVEPTGSVRIVSTGDRVGDTGSTCMPQGVLPQSLISDYCRRIGAACFERKLFGHLSVEFAVFGDPKIIWTTELRFQFTDSAALAQLLQFSTNSSLDPTTQQFLVASRTREGPGRTRPKKATPSVGLTVGVGFPRFGAISSRLWHSGLSTIDCGVFFKLCKSRGIGFDVTDLTGTLFCLVDSVRRDRLCILTVADKPERARHEFQRVLAAIDEDLGPKAPSNFATFSGFSCNSIDESKGGKGALT